MIELSFFWGVTTKYYISVAKNRILKHNWPFCIFLRMSLLLISIIITYQKFRPVVSPLPVLLKYHIIAAIVSASLIQRCINICLHAQLITILHCGCKIACDLNIM